MNSGVRVLKRGRIDSSKSLPVEPCEKTDRQSNREIVSTVKSWIAELDLRRLSRHTEACVSSNNDWQRAFLLNWTSQVRESTDE